MEVSKEQGQGKKIFVGMVTSNKMDKTIVVSITSKVLHPVYHKYVTKTKKIKAHDENNECSIGDKVKVVEFRPISKHKKWKLVEILEKVK